MLKNALLFSCLMLKFCPIFCQVGKQIPKKTTPFEYYFNSGFGFYFPTNGQALLAKSGTVYSFQVQVNYKKRFFTRFEFDQYRINYTDNFKVNGQNMTINDKVEALNIGFDFGYTRQLSKRFSTYGYIGAGDAAIQVPTIRYNMTATNIDISTSEKNFLSFRGGLGGEFEINKVFIVFGELQYLSIPFKTEISDQQLNGVSCIIGFKTPLQ
jgi:Outer membrane protein beta-barrel domain